MLVEPVPDGSTPAPEPEAPVTPGTQGSLPGAPDVPVTAGDATRGPAVTLPSAPPSQPTTVAIPDSPESQVAAAVAATAPAAVTPAPVEASTPPAGPAVDNSNFVFDASGRAVAAITVPQSPPASLLDATTAPPPPDFGPTLVATPGSAPAGSSLLAVLAGYILPGSGPAPAATMMMLVLLGLIMAAIYAPRPQGSEKLLPGGPARPAPRPRPGGSPTRLARPCPWARCVLVTTGFASRAPASAGCRKCLSRKQG